MTTQIASQYWKGQKKYPFDFTRHRRIHELNYLVPRLKEIPDGGSLLDLGCGDGSLLECLIHLTGFKKFYGYDIAADLLAEVNPKVETKVYDLANPGPLPQTNATICAGVIQYLFDDEAVDRVLGLISSPILFVRSTCTLKDEDEPVERDGYASLYRTVAHTNALLFRRFKVVSCDRVYPDEIESPFGTKQYYFECRKRS